MFVAQQIAAYAKGEGFDAIFCGKETIDFNGAEVPGMIAELLDLPFISFANHLEINGSTAKISREIEGGNEIAEVEGAFVLSAAKGLAEQRIPNMRGIMMARKKPLTVVEPVASEANIEVVSYTLPEEKASVKLLDPENMDELVRLLHEEAKVI